MKSVSKFGQCKTINQKGKKAITLKSKVEENLNNNNMTDHQVTHLGKYNPDKKRMKVEEKIKEPSHNSYFKKIIEVVDNTTILQSGVALQAIRALCEEALKNTGLAPFDGTGFLSAPKP